MSKPVIIFSTLYPKNLKVQRAEKNTIALIEEWLKKYKDKCELHITAGSAHSKSVDRIRNIIKKTDEDLYNNSDIIYCPFKYTQNMTERRGHEISYSKQYLFNKVSEYTFDYLCFIDSDIHIQFKYIWKYIKCLKDDEKGIVQLPYMLRRGDKEAPEQFGAFIIPARMVTKNNGRVIYQTSETDAGKLKRLGAPDGRLFKRLKKKGAHKIKAENIVSHHYDKDTVYIYDNGKCSRKRI